MIATLLIWSFLLILTYLYGAAVFAGLVKLLRIHVTTEPGIPLTLLAGLSVITVAAQVANLFIPLGAGFILALLTGGLWIVYRNPSLIQVSIPRYGWLGWIFIALAFVTILENATHFSANPDTGFYHTQTIRWFETYRIVPGLGNLQERYAFNSAWLVLNAAFSLAFLGIQSFRLVNGIMFLTAIFFFAEGLQEILQRKLTITSLAKMLFLVLSYYLLGSEISSVGNDMPVSLAIWIILVLWLERIESPVEDGVRTILIFLLPVLVITIKLSSMPLLLFPIYIVGEHLLNKDWRQIRIFILLSGVIVAPWLMRSVILSGYLVFPFSQLDLFAVDWKMPEGQAEAARQGIIGFARLGNDWLSAIDMPVTQWAPIWFEKNTPNRQAILLLAFFSPILLLMEHALVSRKYIFAYGTMFAGSAFWFLSAPDIRFGYGFLIGACVLTLMPPLVFLITRWSQSMKHLPGLIFAFLIIFQTFILLRSIETDGYPQRLLLPADYRPAVAHTCEIQGAVIYCRNDGAQCQYELFPCIPYPRPAVQMRGDTFRSGFRDLSIEP